MWQRVSSGKLLILSIAASVEMMSASDILFVRA
ncbi:hypothetical protein A2U01_0096869, partial [Trifolium medium]|nr:hypothetical protein [Trifolium medium]